jgi:hypothetical protein
LTKGNKTVLKIINGLLITGMLDKLRKKYSQFLNRPPGKRFIREYERNEVLRKNQPGWKSKIYIGFGILLILMGFLIGLFPGAPGILLSLIGFLIISARSAIAAKILDLIDLLIHLLRKKIKSHLTL